MAGVAHYPSNLRKCLETMECAFATCLDTPGSWLPRPPRFFVKAVGSRTGYLQQDVLEMRAVQDLAKCRTCRKNGENCQRTASELRANCENEGAPKPRSWSAPKERQRQTPTPKGNAQGPYPHGGRPWGAVEPGASGTEARRVRRFGALPTPMAR